MVNREVPFYFSNAFYFEGDSSPRRDITSLIGIDEEHIKPLSGELLALPQLQSELTEASAGYQAFFEFQDILGVSIHEDGSTLLNRHYCYYEAMSYLREYFTSWIDLNPIASLTLVRPFLELALTHIYWFLRCEDEGYRPYEDWLSGKRGKPNFGQIHDYVFGNLPSRAYVRADRYRNLRDSLKSIYSWSCAYNHTPKVEESVVGIRGDRGGVPFTALKYSLSNLNFLLKQIVFLYVLAYPMMLFPVDRFSKWAYGGVLGVFVDRVCASTIKAYLGEKSYASLRDQLGSMEEVTELLNWYHSQPEMTSEQQDEHWVRMRTESQIKSNPDEIYKRLTLHKSYIRGVNWHINYIHDPPDISMFPDVAVDHMSENLKEWD